jgi:hypothetical protein
MCVFGNDLRKRGNSIGRFDSSPERLVVQKMRCTICVSPIHLPDLLIHC